MCNYWAEGMHVFETPDTYTVTLLSRKVVSGLASQKCMRRSFFILSLLCLPWLGSIGLVSPCCPATPRVVDLGRAKRGLEQLTVLSLNQTQMRNEESVTLISRLFFL